MSSTSSFALGIFQIFGYWSIKKQYSITGNLVSRLLWYPDSFTSTYRSIVKAGFDIRILDIRTSLISRHASITGHWISGFWMSGYWVCFDIRSPDTGIPLNYVYDASIGCLLLKIQPHQLLICELQLAIKNFFLASNKYSYPK